MKVGKAPGPSGIVVKMIRAAGNTGASMIRDLAAAIIRDGKVCLTKSRVSLSASTREGGCIWKRKLPRSQANRAGHLSPGEDCGRPHQTVGVSRWFLVWLRPRGTTDTIFVARQLKKKYLAANKWLYMAFIDLEKALDGVPRKVIWWALRKLGVEEWIVQGMYAYARSRVRVGEGYSEEFEVKVGVHQGSVHSPLRFIIVLEALSCEFHSWVPWEDLYADDLIIIAESLEECVRRLLTWRESIEEKGLRVNAGICGTGLDLLQSSGDFPCAVCALEWVATASSSTAASTGCTRNAVCSST